MKSRRQSIEVAIANLSLGGSRPIRVQSMTDTVTADVDGTVRQIQALASEGSELVRFSILDAADAAAVPDICARLVDIGCTVPLVGDFHFNGHALLAAHPACAKALDKYRINPGNVGFGQSYDKNFAKILEIAVKNDKAVRIGANWGSLDERIRQRLLAAHPEWPMHKVLEHAMIESTLESAAFAIKSGFPENRLVLSAKVSHVPTLLKIYRALAEKTDFALHLGLTEAGSGASAVIASTAAMSVLLQEGIGDTLRVSITPSPRADASDEDPRLHEVRVCQQILQTNGLRNFFPTVVGCPGCGRTQREVHRSMVHRVQQFIAKHAKDWRVRFPGSENMVIAVMGCVVNGIKEAQHADMGISLPGRGSDSPVPMVFSDGQQKGYLPADHPEEAFIQALEAYIQARYSAGTS